ncbi:HAD-IA family hydrolase [Streptomyces sulphureus]|uniref:HAD-IA family hydrolase n=1 Tax=Streptomyces sulphureus TaxID=47758 RepID=UPI00036349E5|nr:HAD-IA family hydrolase [Streptomyces sulphureus]
MTSSSLPYDAVLCDLDGVIRSWDDSEIASLEREFGVPAGETARTAFSAGHATPLLLGEVGEAEWTAGVAEALADRLPQAHARQLGEALHRAPQRVDDAVVALLREARTRVPLVLVTNASRRLDADLAALGLADLADHVVNSAAVGVRKPHDGIYRIAAERVPAATGRCLFVDDLWENVLAARRLGMTGVHYRSVEDLSEALLPLAGA